MPRCEDKTVPCWHLAAGLDKLSRMSLFWKMQTVLMLSNVAFVLVKSLTHTAELWMVVIPALYLTAARGLLDAEAGRA